MLKRQEKIYFDPILIVIFPILLLIGLSLSFIKNKLELFIQNNIMQSFTTIFLAITLEAIPFIIIGVFISSLIQVFISEETIIKLIPKNKFVGLLIAGVIGIIFPVCDCAIVPIARRLLKKGMPLYICVTFMLSVPIINPVVLASTYYAFLNNPYMVLLRGGLGSLSAIIIGFIISNIEEKNVMKISDFSSDLRNQGIYIKKKYDNLGRVAHDYNCSCGCNNRVEKTGVIASIIAVLEHTSLELREVGKFVIIGAFLSSLMQTFIPRKYILSIGHGYISSILVMMALAFLLCVCSETDAFIARTFVGQFTNGSIIAFLIFGPMIDIKNTLMLGKAFKARFIMKLIALIFMVCFVIGLTINYIGIYI